MAHGCRITQPNGRTELFLSGDSTSIDKAMDELLPEWEKYCEDNWLNSGDEPFNPESKVKLFLDGLAYLLLADNTEDVVSDYKEMANGKREIPISSCPSQVSDAVYGGKSVRFNSKEKDSSVYKSMYERMDEKCKSIKLPKSLCAKGRGYAKRKARITPSKTDKIREIRRRMGDCVFSFETVDTEGVFSFDKQKWIIGDAAAQYQGKQTSEGVLYDMTRVICVKASTGETAFYDENFENLDFVEVKK